MDRTGASRVLRAAVWTLCLAWFFASPHARAERLEPENVPAPLAPWVDWVLQGSADTRCPFAFDRHAEHQCAWPGKLELALSSRGGSFVQRFDVRARRWVALPGDTKAWPEAVTVDGAPVPVVPRGGVPGVVLEPGARALAGRFGWDRLPESLQLARSTGLVALTVNGRREIHPDLDAGGRLWLARRAAPEEGLAARDTLDIQVFRRIVDSVPMRIETQIFLEVAGEPRELTLGPVLLDGFVPLTLDSTLPARAEADGTLAVQARAGRHRVSLTSRGPGPVHALSPPGAAPGWPGREVWVFQAQNHLRIVRVDGATPVDPRQTSLPEPWRSLPAYQLESGDTLSLDERRRGDPDAEPDPLSLDRTLWLDFDGAGYTVQDRIEGALSRSARLELNAPLVLGRVESASGARFITRLAGDGRRGVELRPGPLALVADSRLEGAAYELPAIGWEYDFASVSAMLNLPPGWRLVAVRGADQATPTWLGRFTLFDLFVVLVIAAAVARLHGWAFGLVALLGLALSYHEPGAPRWIWLNVLAAAALASVLPQGKLRALARLYRAGALAALAVILVPFAAEQIREAAFPQLERAGWAFGSGRAAVAPRAEPVPPRAPAPAAGQALSDAPGVAREALERKAAALAKPSRYSGGREIDPNARIQTGPGLPQWRWQQVRLRWSGPVDRGEGLRLWLVPPRWAGALKAAAVVLVGLLFWRLLVHTPRLRGPRSGAQSAAGGGAPSGAAAVLAIALAATFALIHPGAARAQMPSQAMLDELERRLLEAPDCAPACADNPSVRIQAGPDRLRVALEVHALERVSVPLPGRIGQWRPDTVSAGDEAVVPAARDADGWLWVALEPGIHTILVEGPLPPRPSVQLGFRLEPRRVLVDAEGWTVDGVSGGRLRGGQLQLTREAGGAGPRAPEGFRTRALPPFVTVVRTLELGLEWRVNSTVTRLSPPDVAAVLRVPLLDGESVLSEAVQVSDGGVLVSLAPGQRELAWSSGLEQREGLSLMAPEGVAWTEVWRLDASPIWHVEPSGLPAVFAPGADPGLTQWYPWPGEALELAVRRPEGVPGRTLTIQRSELVLRPGTRATDADLELDYLASQGQEHSLTLPEGARLSRVRIDGREQPLRQSGQALNLPIAPGVHRVALAWRSPRKVAARYETPRVGLGVDSVNSAVEVRPPRDRWTLVTGGPLVGPAVLFWGLLLVIAVVAAGLARTRRTPLGVLSWLLLGVGLSQIYVWLGIVVVAWLLALGERGRAHERGEVAGWSKWRFNLTQVALAALTLAALGVVFFALQQGLLGQPEMQIAGNGSNAGRLRWFVDRAGPELPRAYFISVPLLAYRIAMLLWALWLAIALVGWLRWGFGCYAAGGYWRSIVLRRSKQVPAAEPAEGPAG